MTFSSFLETCCIRRDKAGSVCFSRNIASISRVLTAAAKADSKARNSKGSCLSMEVLQRNLASKIAKVHSNCELS